MSNEDKRYMFVVTACDGRHEHKHGTWEEAHAECRRVARQAHRGTAW